MPFEFGQEVFQPAFASKDTPKVSYGLRFPEACARHCELTFHCSRVYILCSHTLRTKTDALNRLISALGDRVAGVGPRISSHTPLAEVVEAVRDARSKNADCLVTLGAGSLTDAAKLVRVALANGVETEDDMSELWGTQESKPSRRATVNKPTIPLIHIPTSLSGGEYQALAAGTETGTHAKRFFPDGVTDPDLVIQDPELSTTTPDSLWLSTGVRAVDHCVETICSLKSYGEADEAAKRGLANLVSGLMLCKRDATDLSARHTCQQGVVDAMHAVSSGVALGGSHAIGHQLGPLGVGHGETSCILLPAVCKYNAKHKANLKQQRIVRDELLQMPEVKTVLEEKHRDGGEAAATLDSLDLGDVLDSVISALEMPRTLKDVNITSEESMAKIAENSLDDLWARTNPVPITEASQVREILDMCRGS